MAAVEAVGSMTKVPPARLMRGAAQGAGVDEVAGHQRAGAGGALARVPPVLTVKVLVLPMTLAVAPVLVLVSWRVPPLTVAVSGVAGGDDHGAAITSVPVLVNGAAPTFRTALGATPVLSRVRTLPPLAVMVMFLAVPKSISPTRDGRLTVTVCAAA